jgi:hypothetical protein
MKCTQLRWLAMVAMAIVGMVSASSALAGSVNPFSPSTADIQSLSDQTAGFSNSQQLSTIDAIHVAPNGIHLDITWRVGQNSDPFGANFGQTFARVSLATYTNGEDSGQGRLLNPPYDGIKWCLMSDHDSFTQPFLQTAPNWTFYEPSTGGTGIPGDMSLQMSVLAFDDARNFSGLTPPNIVQPDGNGQIRANAFGIQLGGPGGLVVGQPVVGHVWITNWVPEPSTVTLSVLGAVGLLGMARRRRG